MEMGGIDGPSGSIMLSRNLSNSSDHDNSDGSSSCSTWAKKQIIRRQKRLFCSTNYSFSAY